LKEGRKEKHRGGGMLVLSKQPITINLKWHLHNLGIEEKVFHA